MAKNRLSPTLPVAPRASDLQNLLVLAVKFMQGGLSAQARSHCQQVLDKSPGHAQANYILGLLAVRAGNLPEAAERLAQSLASDSSNAPAHNNLGVVLKRLDRLPEAAASFEKAVALKRDYVEARHNLGNTLQALGHLPAALASHDQSLALRPDFAQGHNNRGMVLARLHRYTDALASFARAVQLQPDFAVAHANAGNALVALRQYDHAMAAFDRAIDLEPTCAEHLEGRAIASTGAKQPAQAAAFYARLVALAPDFPFAKGNLLHARMLCADWTDFESLYASIQTGLAAGLPVAEPFGLQGISHSEADLLVCAKTFNAVEFPAAPLSQPQVDSPPGAADRRITIGYLCGEFRQHATTILMCGVYEAHDKSRFKLIAFDNGGSDGSDYRRRVEAAFDEVIDICALGDTDAADLIKQKNVDVLVDLNGYFGEGRMGVFAQRPCAIQVNYLGFPGTSGAAYLDYLIADAAVLPPESHAWYTEKIVTLPHCYQASDDKRTVSHAEVTRAQFNLPAAGFVFCCFNNSYKITPATFDSWMRILDRVPASCLWLLAGDHTMVANLQQAAQNRGVDPARLVFGERVAPDVHLSRHRLAGLFLDTLPYNAHTTASDALWAGLPVLAQTGTTFPGRVTTSMLRALGMPQLVTRGAQAYEDRAVELAQNTAALQAVRARLKEQVRTAPLFDTQRLTRTLEAAFRTMVERHRAGLPPGHFTVPDQNI